MLLQLNDASVSSAANAEVHELVVADATQDLSIADMRPASDTRFLERSERGDVLHSGGIKRWVESGD